MSQSNRNDTPVFTIGIVAEMVQLHPQTLRQYERLGLVIPHRRKGRSRVYSRQNVEQIRLVTTLTRRHGVNLAGVGIILKLQQRLEDLRREAEQLFENLQRSLAPDRDGGSRPSPGGGRSHSRSPAVRVKVERG